MAKTPRDVRPMGEDVVSVNVNVAAPPDTSELKQDIEWLAVVSELRARKARLVSDFEVRYPANALYGDLVPQSEIDDMADATMEMYVELLSGGLVEARLIGLPTTLGRRRARQGVPVRHLLDSVRGNTFVIWNALREIAADSVAAMSLVRHTDTVLGLVEWHVGSVQSAYLAEEEWLNRNNERRRQLAIARLFENANSSREELDAIVVDLGVARDAAFEVVFLPGVHEIGCSACALPGERMFAYEGQEGTCHFRCVSDTNLLMELAGTAAVVIPEADDVALLPSAASAAAALAGSLGGAGDAADAEPVLVDAAWPAVAWQALSERVPVEFLPMNLAALQNIKPDERERLAETVERYLETGSIKETCESLYCHRNTIVKRLARFESLTGLNVSVPKQAALALLALSALRFDC